MAKFLELLLAAPEVKPLLSCEHFSLDGTLLRAWASHSSLERIDGSDDEPRAPSGGNGFGGTAGKEKTRAKGDFRGLLLSYQSHRSSSDGEARLFRKSGGTGAFLSYLGHCLMENRHGLVVASEVTAADGYGGREAALRMARSLPGAYQKTLAADKGYDTRDFVANIRFAGITPHVAQNIQSRRRSAIDGRTIRHAGYAQSINVKKRIELSGDSENWTGGDTKTGPPRGARQHTHVKAGIDAISGADGFGDGGADPSGRGGDAAAGGSGMGPAAGRLAALRQAQPRLAARRPAGLAAAAVSGPPRQCRCGAAGTGE
jgi:hypothetical protein